MKIVARKRLTVALSALSILGLALLMTPGCSPSNDTPAKTTKRTKKTDAGKKTAKTSDKTSPGKTVDEKTEAAKTAVDKTEAAKTQEDKTEAVKTEPVKTEAKPEVKTEAKPEVKTEAKPEVKTEAKPEVKTEAKPEVKTEPKPEIKTEPKPEAEEKPEVVKPGSDKQAPPGTTAPKRKLKPRTTRTEKPGKIAVMLVAAPVVAKAPAEKPVSTPVVVKPAGPIAANGDSKNPTYAPAPAWLPKPVAENAAAEAKAEMKPYTETVPDTDAKFDMLPIKGGKFTMGTSDEDFRRHNPKDESDKNAKEKPNDEGPQHEVDIEPFWMGKCEVTWDEYEQWSMKLDAQRRKLKRGDQPPSEREALVDAIAMPTNPYSDMTFGMGKEGYPAICMTQFSAKMYCKWLSAKTGHYYRLPTEAEWEYAARAGTKTAYSFGEEADKLEDFGWFFDNAEDKYHKVGQKKPNPWGLHDMHGNVAEWVLDQYTVDGYKPFAGKVSKDPLVAATTEYGRVVRGGSWADDPPALRSTARRPSIKDWKNQDPQIPQSIWYLTDAKFVGFRVVRPLRVPTPEEAKKYDIDAQQFEQMEDYKKANPGKM
jgi:formylglycine-generating enzyme required for sulfatase activity